MERNRVHHRPVNIEPSDSWQSWFYNAMGKAWSFQHILMDPVDTHTGNKNSLNPASHGTQKLIPDIL